MKRLFLPLLTFTFALHLSILASPVVKEVTVYPFAATITHQADLVIEEYVPLDAKRPGKKWTFKNPNVSKRTVWRVTAESNTVFNAWLDTDGNGKYDIGEPFGTSAGRDYPEIELSNFSPITPRIDLVEDTGDRKTTRADVRARIENNTNLNIQTILRFLNGNPIADRTLEKGSHIGQRVRVVRWMLNDVPVFLADVDAKVVLDKTIETDVRSCLTEADFLIGTESFDIDWDSFYTDVIRNTTAYSACGNITNVSYLVVVGDGDVSWNDFDTSNTVYALNTVVERKYGRTRCKPKPVAPVVIDDRVTLRWMMDAPEIEGYTAYRAKILSGSTEVHDTDLFRNPARWADGSFHWTITNSIPAGTYSWKIAAYNSKFSNEQDSAYTNGVPFTVTGE